MTGSSRRRTATRAVAFAVSVTGVLSVTAIVGAERERRDLPISALRFRQATIDATALTTCLQGARDELYVPGRGALLHDPGAVSASLARLRGCDVASLSSDLGRLELPPTAAVTSSARRLARADMVTGTAVLRQVVLDARGASAALERQVHGAADGTAVVLAYRSAASGSSVASGLADEALALLGDPQSTVT